jgi:hypothetical protein
LNELHRESDRVGASPTHPTRALRSAGARARRRRRVPFSSGGRWGRSLRCLRASVDVAPRLHPGGYFVSWRQKAHPVTKTNPARGNPARAQLARSGVLSISAAYHPACPHGRAQPRLLPLTPGGVGSPLGSHTDPENGTTTTPQGGGGAATVTRLVGPMHERGGGR